MSNSANLENAVMLGTPEEAAAACHRLCKGENSCLALAIACRFRGLKYVKALVESGATFKYVRPEGQVGYYAIYYWLAPLEMTEALRTAYFINSDKCFSDAMYLTDIRGGAVKTMKLLPIEERVEIVKYLCENSERVLFDPGELLYYSIISRTAKITEALKECGVRFTEKRTAALTEGGRGYVWQEFNYMAEKLTDEEYLDVMRKIVAELDGKKLHYTDAVYWTNFNTYHNRTRLFDPEVFGFILDNFNQKKMNKAQLMRAAIDANSTECLAMCAEQGWLKAPKKRDEMIAYSTAENKTECTAFLLDFKNKNFDLAAERAKAEKKMEQELNAAPDSVSEMKKLWSYKKLEDGTLVITSYKGTRGEIIVPSQIGKSEVSEIGAYAFSSSAPRLKIEQRDFRLKEITRVTLPKTITKIGKGAFSSCEALEEINIPEGVVEIKEEAFMGCRKLAALVIPDSVKTIGKSSFVRCLGLRSIKLPEGLSEIGDYLLSNCPQLSEIKLPAGIQSIGIWALARCRSLEEVVIPEGVAEIKRQAFMGCEKLKTVVIPASVKSIKNYVYRKQPPETIFEDSPNVTAVVEPKSCAERYCDRHGIAFKYREEK